MFECNNCKKDSKSLIADECYDCIRQDPEKEARLRQHFARFDEGGPPPGYPTFFDWLVFNGGESGVT